MNNTLWLKDILSTKQLTKQHLEIIFGKAIEMEDILSGKKDGSNILKWKIMASLFYEPSTRTRLSFETAMKRLGWEVITVANEWNTSLSKWETLEDNAKINGIYSDILVMRHPEIGSVERTAKATNKPVINAWDGSNQHPTQALLDVYTIFKERWTLENLQISIVWDLKYGRTTHSLVFLMGLYKGVSFKFISPEELKMPEKVTSFLKENNIHFEETINYKTGITNSDVIYVTRLQKERFSDISEYERLKNNFILTKDVLNSAHIDVTIMHPLPRVNEVSPEVDTLPNAAFFRQAENGITIRMALLSILLWK